MDTKKYVIRVTENDIQGLSDLDISKEPACAQMFLAELTGKFFEKLPGYKKQNEKNAAEMGVKPYSKDYVVSLRMEIPDDILKYCHEKDNIFGKVHGGIDKQIIYVLEELPQHPERKFY